ncbi:integrase [Halobacteriales archaeon QH_7_66_37]|nr:MAG: integrase [Halobacteriales archaeon QH_7_66_37]
MSETGRGEGTATDQVAYFLEDITYQGKSERTRDAYERVLTDFREYLRSRDLTFEEANHRDCMAYVHQLRGEVADSTVATYASYLHRFYDYMLQVGRFDDNPMALVLEEIDESINTDPARRDISVPAMQSFVERVSHPLDRAVVVTLLKTGIRAGELCNLDMRDLYLAESFVPDTHRPRLDGRPQSLYVDSTPSAGSLYNGERRTASNKRKRDTTVPVDEELTEVRLTPDMVHHIVETHAREMGWYRAGGGPEENVTPHYFRHFFTTHLRDRTGDRGVVKYLRGDVASDVIDTYTHDWGGRVRAVYEEHIYKIC